MSLSLKAFAQQKHSFFRALIIVGSMVFFLGLAPMVHACTAGLTINGSAFSVGDSWRLTVNTDMPNESFSICGGRPDGSQGCMTSGTSPDGTSPSTTVTDSNGNWTGTGVFPSSTIGNWTEWMEFPNHNNFDSNQIQFTVSAPAAVVLTPVLGWSATYTINGSTTGNFLVGQQWTLGVSSNIPNQSFGICGIRPDGSSGCAADGVSPDGTSPSTTVTDSNGIWTGMGAFPSSTIGNWVEWVQFPSGTISNRIAFTVGIPASTTPTCTSNCGGMPPLTIVIAPVSLPNGTTTVPYAVTLTATGTAPGPFAWSVASGTLPIGLMLGTSTAATTSIVGVPTTSGTYSFIVNVTNGSVTASQAYTVTIGAATNCGASGCADIAVTKTIDNASPQTGATVHYTLTVNALGPATSTNVVATDIWPIGLALISASSSQGTFAFGSIGRAASAAGPAVVNLGSAGNFVILAKTGISTTGSTSIVGDVGVSPAAASYMTGFGLTLPAASAFSTSALVTGKVYAADYANPTPAYLTTAVLDMQNAYTDAAGRAVDVTGLGAGDIGGLTLVPGVYKWGTNVTIPTDLALSGGPNDIWIFQVAGNLTMSSATHVILSGGAQASNVFWVVAGQTTIGTTAVFNGNILDQTAIVLNTGAILNGRALAQSAVTLDSNTVTVASSTGIWTIGTMAPGTTATLNVVATVTASAGIKITNTATVTESSSSTDLNPGNNTASTTITVGSGGTTTYADIAVAKTVDNANPVAGDTVHYLVTATALGPATSTFVDVRDLLPAGLSLLNATTSQGLYNLGTGDWNIGTMSPNATATLAIAVAIDTRFGGQAIANTATISELSSLADNNPANNSSSVSIAVGTSSVPFLANLGVTKIVDNPNPNTGDIVHYLVVISDHGPASSTNVVATDTLPFGLTFMNATTSQGVYASTTGTWFIGNMPVSSTATLAVTALVTASSGITIVNTVNVEGTPDPSASATLTVASLQAATVTPSGCTSNCGGVSVGVGAGPGGTGGGLSYNFNLLIDGGAPTTATTSAILTLSATGATQMWISDDQSFSTSTNLGQTATSTGGWIPFQETYPWTLTSGSGEKTVYARFGNSGLQIGSSQAAIQLLGSQSVVTTVSTSVGQVLGTSISCGLYLNDYIRIGWNNDSNEVRKLQIFLNGNMGTNLPVTGIYGQQDFATVEQFQVKYGSQVLAPWVPLGLPNQMTPTGFVYQTTKWWINHLYCESLNIPMPSLQVYQGS